MATPAVPQRPVRSQKPTSHPTSAGDVPMVPPRPARYRSTSPTREAFTRSPLNDSPFAAQRPSIHTSMLETRRSNDITMHRHPSVDQLPLVGQEGMEYASIDEGSSSPEQTAAGAGKPTHTRNVAGDLPLHAPKASVDPSTARNQIATVTRTDSSAAAHIGNGRPSMDLEDSGSSLRRQSSTKPFELRESGHNSPDISRSASRPGSFYGHEHEHGIPEIGLQVPMYPNAGDVQAPSPGPSAQPSTGIGFFNNGSRTSLSQGSNRRKSAQGFHGPPGSYGMHGHGVQAHDSFEKSWYQKHPEELQRDKEGAYGAGLGHWRGEWAMSSEDLNRLVRQSSSRNVSTGTTPGMIGTPSEDIGFMATEEFITRTSPRSGPLHLTKSHSRTLSGPQHIYSPLRTASSAQDAAEDEAAGNNLEDDPIHLDPPVAKHDKIHGGGYDPPTADLGPAGGNTEELGGWIDERGTGTPILASDEVAKDPSGEYLHPAISPELEKSGDGAYLSSDDPHAHYQSAAEQRNASRPRSTKPHESLGTPLENVEEYEPLFEDDEEEEAPITATDRFKRTQMGLRRFPSQDVWEDTPDSMQYTTTVQGPQEPDSTSALSDASKAASSTFELPDKELKRKGEITEEERRSFLADANRSFARPKFSAGVEQELSRPGMRHRFPSQDIWEDTPDSLRLETTIDEKDSGSTVRSPTTGETIVAKNSIAQSMEAVDPALTAPIAKPAIPPRPARTHAADPTQATPSIPSRPAQRHHEAPPPEPQLNQSPVERKAPELPERPRPHVPPRPARAVHEHPSEPVPTSITKTISADSTSEATSPTDVSAAPVTKAKPSIPAKPTASGKIAALRAGFMNDLNSRLQLGPTAPPKPQPPPETETAEEKVPLADARKGRARGPARRTPAAKVAEPADVISTPSKGKPKVSFSEVSHVWSINPNAPYHLQVGQQKLATIPGNVSHADMDARARSEEAQKQADLAPHIGAMIGHPGDVPEPVSPQSATLRGDDNMDEQPPSVAQRIMGTDALQPALESQTLETAPATQDTEPLLAGKQAEPTATSFTAGGAEANTGEAAENDNAQDQVLSSLKNTTQIAAEAETQEPMPGGFPVTTAEG